MVKIFELIKIIENIAPPQTAEPWDMSGWLVQTAKTEVQKVMLCLTVTKNVISQAKKTRCDMIISHHPLFFIPFEYNCGIDIYSAHTNLDKAPCGTTETLINRLGFNESNSFGHDFLRFIDCETSLDELIERLKVVSENIRFSNPTNIKTVKRLAFCAGSGADFWHDAKELGAEVLITGDLKFHVAVDSEISIIDIGHFESEILVLDELKRILAGKVEVIEAEEKSIINQINS